MVKKSKGIPRKEVINRLEELTKLIQQTTKLKTAQKCMGKASVPDVPPDGLQDLLNFLRVTIKYQLFDINAYRLEVLYLQKICKENNIDV